jgi:hypothetical protein
MVSLAPVRFRDRTALYVGGARENGATLEAGTMDGLRELGSEDFLVEVIDTFLDDAPALVATLKTSRERGDAEELRRTAHSLKSNGQTRRRRRDCARGAEPSPREGQGAAGHGVCGAGRFGHR